MLTDGRGRLVQFRLRPGNAAEVKELPALLADVPLTATRELLADKAYDSDGVRRWLSARDITATIPGRSHRKEPVEFDEGSYQRRHRVENTFSDLKQFRGIACRYAKLAASYAGMVSLVAWFLRTKPNQRQATAYPKATAIA